MINNDRENGSIGVNTAVEVPSLESQALEVLTKIMRLCSALGYPQEEKVQDAPSMGNKVDVLSQILSTISSKLSEIEVSINRL